MMDVLVARKVCKRFYRGEICLEVLKDIDLSIKQGEFAAIMGPSGSGKSTLLYLLGGLDLPTKGQIMLNGRNLENLSDKEASMLRRREIGFIFQFYNLMPVLNVEENITLPVFLDGGDLKKYKDRLESILNKVELLDRRKHRPSQLSGGQQQRVAIARALFNSPKVILADEPTGNLDSTSGEGILKLLRQLCDREGRTIVLVTHDVKAAGYADRIIRLKDGKIV